LRKLKESGKKTSIVKQGQTGDGKGGEEELCKPGKRGKTSRKGGRPKQAMLRGIKVPVGNDVTKQASHKWEGHTRTVFEGEGGESHKTSGSKMP